MMDLSAAMKFEKLQGMENVINHGENGNKFYIMLKGVVNIQIPNQ